MPASQFDRRRPFRISVRDNNSCRPGSSTGNRLDQSAVVTVSSEPRSLTSPQETRRRERFHAVDDGSRDELERPSPAVTRFTYSCLVVGVVVVWLENGSVADRHHNDSAGHQVRERYVGGARPAAVAQRVKVHTHPGRRGRMESHQQDAGTLWSTCRAFYNPCSSYMVWLVKYKQIQYQ